MGSEVFFSRNWQATHKFIYLFPKQTPLILPVTVILFRYIAMITKQKSFNRSLVDQHSQVIFLNEAHTGLLDPEDWKILTQGGLTAHDRKYKKTTPAIIRCTMFITCQKEVDFGEDHNGPMDVLLRKFHFRSLTSPPVAGVQQHLKQNVMDCLVWASRVAPMPDNELPLTIPPPSAEQQAIGEEEKGRIRNFRLEDSESN